MAVTQQMLCPLCSELFTDTRHAYKHFHYRRFLCGEEGCNRKFYTEDEKVAHCAEEGHRETFKSQQQQQTQQQKWRLLDSIVRFALRTSMTSGTCSTTSVIVVSLAVSKDVDVNSTRRLRGQLTPP
ncbi:hypothetical protein CRE_24523 [Caenorhabditis remanei]|uniref:Uncharacterized protein n=1 Tax=Caenorhabditis remanei TaxID=31234 RepID=E3MG30_CAERE|nr:hypothetical protein CRE_24523 [Caenorhabditis remanei]